ncbi:hypothetical protein Vadar_016040 [Vaccinium darrowii]|uniref:Uncharacterized protein n=1 Tax=Vaccinium darrowii TaxID=229202 RepID=A0ACB7Y865_9ERIC|nr:hypothetical protein Vadar_016040 [Vaccinium darrowii]
MAKENQLPWMCVGDFSEVGSVLEKQRGAPCSRNRIENFQNIISECNLMDLEFKGNSFTWTNNQSGEANIRERIDRAMANVEWRKKFSKAQVFHDVILGSDHCPLIINLTLPLKKIPKLFKFESMWSTHPDCKVIISLEWLNNVPGSMMFKFVQKLKHCRRKLVSWSKEEFGNNKLKLALLRDQLASIQTSPASEALDHQQRQIKGEIELLLDREEMFYHQRSRVRWLSYGDRNTSFFHTSMIQRRQRNQLLRLKDDQGSWLESEVDINAHLGNYFSDLFHSRGNRNLEEVLSVIPEVITPDMNSSLIHAVSDEEIEMAVYQLGALKAPGPDGYPGFFYQTLPRAPGPAGIPRRHWIRRPSQDFPIIVGAFLGIGQGGIRSVDPYELIRRRVLSAVGSDVRMGNPSQSTIRGLDLVTRGAGVDPEDIVERRCCGNAGRGCHRFSLGGGVSGGDAARWRSGIEGGFGGEERN